MGQEKLQGLYWLVKGGGWWTERQWDRWTKGTNLRNYNYTQISVGNPEKESHW
jgi:hypothetical protein